MRTTPGFQLSVDSDTLSRLEAAASVAGSSVAEFVREAALARAADVLAGWSQTRVPPEFFDAMIAALDAPYAGPPSPAT